MEPEEQLAGGNMGPVSRRGGVVLRTAGDWTPAVHRLLRHCRERGLTGVPEPLGIEPDGREVIGFLDGTLCLPTRCRPGCGLRTYWPRARACSATSTGQAWTPTAAVPGDLPSASPLR